MRKDSRPGRRAVLAASLALAAGAPAAAQTAPAVGTVSRVAGAPTVANERGSGPARLGMTISEGDRIATGPGGRLVISGADGTTITIGEQTTLAITRFTAPGGGRRGIGVIDMLEGILRILLPSQWDRFDVTTGTAVASVRSTEWLVEATAESTGVFVIDGRVAVRGQAGTAPRTRGVAADGAVSVPPGFGTDVIAAGIPIAPRRWGQPRVDAALARLALP